MAPRRVTPVVQIHEMVRTWERDDAEKGEEPYPYDRVVREALFHGDMRYDECEHFRGDGEFPTRLLRWLSNAADERHRRALTRLLPLLLFVDERQMASLHKDVYRRVIVPWVWEQEQLTAEDLLSPDYDASILASLTQRYRLFYVTESFRITDFYNANGLVGVPKATMLGEDPVEAAKRVAAVKKPGIDRAIVFEDFVGSGKQAGAVLREVARATPEFHHLLFAPLIALEAGIDSVFRGLSRQDPLSRFDVVPGLVIPRGRCLAEAGEVGEPKDFPILRTLVRQTATRVLEADGALDDPPKDAFGYGGCGALVVTFHNVPNNTLPLVHHRAPDWQPLFRRVHHGRG